MTRRRRAERRAEHRRPDAQQLDRGVAAVEVEGRGSEGIRHKIDGKTVSEYTKPQYDPNDKDAKKLLAGKPAGSPQLIEGGSISLQSESHPVEFRKVELLQLKP